MLPVMNGAKGNCVSRCSFLVSNPTTLKEAAVMNARHIAKVIPFVPSQAPPNEAN